MAKKNKDDIDFDLDGSSVDESQEVKELKAELEKLEKLNFKYEKIIRDNGFADQLNKEFSDEEYICSKGIQTIKALVFNQIATKDDINMFDVLYRNLNTIRGIASKNIKKEKPKSREELISIIKGGVSS